MHALSESLETIYLWRVSGGSNKISLSAPFLFNSVQFHRFAQGDGEIEWYGLSLSFPHMPPHPPTHTLGTIVAPFFLISEMSQPKKKKKSAGHVTAFSHFPLSHWHTKHPDALSLSQGSVHAITHTHPHTHTLIATVLLPHLLSHFCCSQSWAQPQHKLISFWLTWGVYILQQTVWRGKRNVSCNFFKIYFKTGSASFSCMKDRHVVTCLYFRAEEEALSIKTIKVLN